MEIFNRIKEMARAVGDGKFVQRSGSIVHAQRLAPSPDVKTPADVSAGVMQAGATR